MNTFHLGPMPGLDLSAAAEITAGETGAAMTIPTLAERGIIGEQPAITCALLPDVHVDVGPRSLVITARPQTFSHRLKDQRQRDLEQLHHTWGTVEGTILMTVLGPWSLISTLELSDGHLALTDSGARRDLPQILRAAIAEHRQLLQRNFGCPVDVIVLEPALTSLAAGTVPGTSDFDTIDPIPAEVLEQSLNRWLGGEFYLKSSMPHLGNPAVLMIDREDLCDSTAYDMFGERVSGGQQISLGINPSNPDSAAADVLRLWDTIGLAGDTLPVALYPARPLGAQPVRTLRQLNETAELLKRQR